MVTYEDCLALAGLSPETVESIAAREHLPQIVALELACCLAAAAPRAQPSRLVDGAHDGRTGAGFAASRARTATAEVPSRAA
jgi:hypothetical protein